MTRILTPTVRRWLYGVAIAFVPLAVWLGWVQPEAVPLILPLVMAVLNVQDEEGKDRAHLT